MAPALDLPFFQPREMAHCPAFPISDIFLPVLIGRLWGHFLKSEQEALGLVEWHLPTVEKLTFQASHV